MAAYLAADEDPRVMEAQSRSPPGNSDFNFAGANERAQVQDEVMRACLQRAAYRLAKAEGPPDEIADSVVISCGDIARESGKLPIDLNGRTIDQRVPMWRGEAKARVIEARAGHCWAQKF